MVGATITNATVLRNTTFGDNVWLTAILCAVFVLRSRERDREDHGSHAAERL